MSIELAALRIGFIGAGRVAQTLAPAFDRAGLNVAAFYNRGPMRRRLGSGFRQHGR
jgi:3-hydroxyisobutyrate dehydrogenase-like beta-hydroxyacid dehydrogenase